ARAWAATGQCHAAIDLRPGRELVRRECDGTRLVRRSMKNGCQSTAFGDEEIRNSLRINALVYDGDIGTRIAKEITGPDRGASSTTNFAAANAGCCSGQRRPGVRFLGSNNRALFYCLRENGWMR